MRETTLNLLQIFLSLFFFSRSLRTFISHTSILRSSVHSTFPHFISAIVLFSAVFLLRHVIHHSSNQNYTQPTKDSDWSFNNDEWKIALEDRPSISDDLRCDIISRNWVVQEGGDGYYIEITHQRHGLMPFVVVPHIIPTKSLKHRKGYQIYPSINRKVQFQSEIEATAAKMEKRRKKALHAPKSKRKTPAATPRPAPIALAPAPLGTTVPIHSGTQATTGSSHTPHGFTFTQAAVPAVSNKSPKSHRASRSERKRASSTNDDSHHSTPDDSHTESQSSHRSATDQSSKSTSSESIASRHHASRSNSRVRSRSRSRSRSRRRSRSYSSRHSSTRAKKYRKRRRKKQQATKKRLRDQRTAALLRITRMKAMRKLIYARRHLDSDSEWSSSRIGHTRPRNAITFDANYFPRISGKVALRIPGWNYYEKFRHFICFPTLAAVAQLHARTNRRPDCTSIFRHRANNVQDDLIKLFDNHDAWRSYIKHTLKIGAKVLDDKPLINTRILCFDSLNLMTAIATMIRHNNFYCCDAEAAALHARDSLMYLYITAGSIAEGLQPDAAWNTLFKRLETIDDTVLRKAKPRTDLKLLTDFESRMQAKNRSTPLHIHQLRNDRRLDASGYPTYDATRYHVDTTCQKFPVFNPPRKNATPSTYTNTSPNRLRAAPSQPQHSYQPRSVAIPQPAYHALVNKRDSQGHGFCIKYWMAKPCHQSPCTLAHKCPICETIDHKRTACPHLPTFLSTHA